ncbi:hypothetical protein R1sor_027504 [Riccia sorocarpa]|uniref:Uncharacterized protein n=1 Tax=Riccia sorocarpa TaxID=122646 RepID=A0ABD3GFV5_9MARC
MLDPKSSHCDDDDHQQHDQASNAMASEEEEVEVAENNKGGENEEEETVGTLDLLRMVKANEIRQHKGLFCIEMGRSVTSTLVIPSFMSKKIYVFFLKPRTSGSLGVSPPSWRSRAKIRIELESTAKFGTRTEDINAGRVKGENTDRVNTVK